MNESSFVDRREKSWQRLMFLNEKADASPTQLTTTEVNELLRLHRRVSGDLAKLRTFSANDSLIRFLNDLVSRSYSNIYRPVRGSTLAAIRLAIATAASTARRCRAFIFASAALTLFAIIFGYCLFAFVPRTQSILVPPGLKESFEGWVHGEIPERNGSESVGASLFYASHNPVVSIGGASVGVASFGVGSAAMMFENGVMLGTLTAAVGKTHRTAHLYIWITPHGVTEFSGIVVAGGAGFVMGWALIKPGRRSRAESLKAAGKDAIVLLVTSVVMMFMAAPIEGFFSFNPKVPDFLKIIFALSCAIAWYFFWSGVGRELDRPSPEAA